MSLLLELFILKFCVTWKDWLLFFFGDDGLEITGSHFEEFYIISFVKLHLETVAGYNGGRGP